MTLIWNENGRPRHWHWQTGGRALWCWSLVIAVCLACVRAVSAAPPPTEATAGEGISAPAPAVVDVVLSSRAMLEGRVLDGDQRPVAGAPIAVIGAPYGRAGSTELRSNATGCFSLGPLSGGVYTVVLERHAFVVRVWTDPTAPPIATRQLILKTENRANRVVRGQSPLGEFFWSDRFLLGATIAGAIAIPVAIHANRHTDNPSGS